MEANNKVMSANWGYGNSTSDGGNWFMFKQEELREP
jgi:hypothetical protein